MAYLGEEIKKLGFGLMRLPKNGEEIDIEQTKKMVDRFLEQGFAYFDTSYARRWWSATPGKNLSWRRNLQPGLTAKAVRRR